MKRIASWNSSKFLTYSSLLFTLPAGYGYYCYNLYFTPLVLFGTTIISVNFWRDALYDWRRTLDLYYAKITLTCCVYNGIMHCPTSYTLCIGFPTLYGSLYCFNKSGEMYKYRKYTKSWIVYHMGFHTLVTTQLFALMYFMGKNNIKIENS